MVVMDRPAPEHTSQPPAHKSSPACSPSASAIIFRRHVPIACSEIRYKVGGPRSEERSVQVHQLSTHHCWPLLGSG